jgi:integrating conjugative element protein (TIGR03757 family)
MGPNRGCPYRIFLSISVGLGSIALAHNAAAEPIQAEYFTDSRHFPMAGDSHGTAVTQYDLAAPVLLEQTVSVGLPADPLQAEAVAKAWFKANQAKLSGQLQAAYACHAKALDYGLKFYPAWVFDGWATVYGVTDLREGLAIYQEWLSKNGNPTQTGGDFTP